MTTPSTGPNQGNLGGPLQNLLTGLVPPLGQTFNSALVNSANALAGFLGEGINPLHQPGNLKTLVYSPEVRVVIAHNEIQYDISSDIVRCTLQRAEKAAASFIVTVHNKDLRYTPNNAPRFSRMDRIVVFMKKTSWTQVFSGYLDTVPYRQLYPGTVDFKATCTIKRLMHTWFNPDLPESNDILNQYTADAAGIGSDSGLATLLRKVLINVGGWRVEDINIQNFPLSFFDFLTTEINRTNTKNPPNFENLKRMMLGSDTSPGPGAYAGHNPNAGTPGPNTPGVGGIPGASAGTGDALTAFYVQQIVAACDERGMGPLVSDNNVGAGLTQAGQTGMTSGGPSDNPSNQKAWQQVQQTGQDYQSANRNSDAAILGTAAAMTDSGGGVGIRNLYNPAVPGSDQFPNDGPSALSTCTGIMQQAHSAEWGDVAQRMNPKQAAGMFFYSLNRLNWRNMDPSDACNQVQHSTVPGKYTPAITAATELVKAYRTATAGTASTVNTGTAMSPTISAGTSSTTSAASAGLGAAPGTNPNLVTGAASSSPAPVLQPGAVNPTRALKPQPDSEGAINWTTTVMGRPTVIGSKGPAAYDPAGLVSQAFKSIGVSVPEQITTIQSAVPRVYPNTNVQRGDIVIPSSGHVVIWGGDGTVIEASQTSNVVQRVPSWIGDPPSWVWVGRACLNGGMDPTAPFNPPELMGPGNPPGALDQQGGAGPGAGGAGDAQARNLFSYIFTSEFTSQIAQQFGGERAFMVGMPLITMIQAIAASSLRCWSSGPDGSFVAWYPDYWGLDGKPAVMLLEDIELKDVTINFSDDPLCTHVYIAGDETFGSGEGQLDPVAQWLSTTGIVNVEDAQTWLYQRLIQIAPLDENLSGSALLKRYGVRPFKQEFAMAGNHDLEFLLATHVFMEKWAQQYQTQISMTFMPELMPGMRIELAGKNLQVYVSAVTHVCDYEQGFYTQATIMAPSVPMAKRGMAGAKTVWGPPANAIAFAQHLPYGAVAAV